MKKYFLFGLLFIGGMALLGFVIDQTGIHAIWLTVKQISPVNYLAYLGMGSAVYFLMAIRWKILLSCHGHKLGIFKLFMYRLAAYAVSYITPAQVGGEPVRIYLVSQTDGIRLRDATSSVLTDKLFELSATVTFITAGVIYLAFTNLVSDSLEWGLFAVITVFVSLLAFCYHRVMSGRGVLAPVFRALGCQRIKRLQHWEERIVRTEQRIAEFLNHKHHRRVTIPAVSLLSLAIVSFSILEHWLLAYFLGINLSFTQAFLVATIPLVAYILPLPLGLGVFEAAHVGLFVLLGYSPASALAVVIGIRTKDIIASLIGFIYATTHGVHLIGRKRNVPTKKELKSLRTTAEEQSFRSLHSHSCQHKKNQVNQGSKPVR